MGRQQVNAFRCDRCGHVWLPRDLGDKIDRLDDFLPVYCPNCHSGYWNRPRKIGNTLDKDAKIKNGDK